MHQARIGVSGLIIRNFEIGFYLIEQIVVLALVGAAGRHLRLQNDDDMVILEKDFEGRTIVLWRSFSH